ncbi:MAG: hypothetical protein JW919_05965, partial [Candidatus Omnitrophica bacterium]|nr:hypothetical protein [Candidatus Omnitrophota bacterium]
MNILNKFLIPVLFVVILAIGISLRIHNLNNVPDRSPDEGIYTYQAATIVERGTEGFKLLAREHGTDKRLWIYPPPHRAGYLWALSAAMKSTNSSGIKTGSYISSAFSVLSLILLVLIGWRFFNRWV